MQPVGLLILAQWLVAQLFGQAVLTALLSHRVCPSAILGHNGLWDTRALSLLESTRVRDAAPSWPGRTLGPLSHPLEVKHSMHGAGVRAPTSRLGEEEKWVPRKEIWHEYPGGQVVSVMKCVGPPRAQPCPSPPPPGLAPCRLLSDIPPLLSTPFIECQPYARRSFHRFCS